MSRTEREKRKGHQNSAVARFVPDIPCVRAQLNMACSGMMYGNIGMVGLPYMRELLFEEIIPRREGAHYTVETCESVSSYLSHTCTGELHGVALCD
jgi:hypothetical protein